LLTAEVVKLRRSAAAVKLPASATQMKTAIPFKRCSLSTDRPHCGIDFHYIVA